MSQQGLSASRTEALLEEIVVTATKKAGGQTLQEAPVAISAFSADQLELLKVNDIEDLNYSVPNASLGNVGSIKSVANFSIRGMGVNSSIPSVEPAVGTFIDGVYQGNNFGVIVDFMDVEAIEVLRGPQGLLFGRNVTGGAVLIRSARPTDEFTGKLSARFESGPEKTYTGVLNGALGDAVNGRLAVYYKDDDGWFKNEFNGDDFGEEETLVVRPSLSFELGESRHTLITETGDVEGDGSAIQGGGLFDDHDIGLDNDGYIDIEWSRITLESTWDVDFGSGAITNIFGWREVESDTQTDLDGSPVTQFAFSVYLDQDQWSDELRYNGTFGKADITSGLYYFTQDVFTLTENALFGGRATNGGKLDHYTWGVFSQLDYHVTDSLTLTGGLRYSAEKKEADVAPAALLACNYDTKSCSQYFSDDDDWTFVTPKVGFTWHFSPDSQLYGSYSRGNRSGGFNLRQNVVVIGPGGVSSGAPPFDQEEQDSIELGLKSSFNEGRTTLNLAVFYNEVDGLQKDVTVTTATQSIQNTANTADATTQGFEVEFNHRIFDNLVLSGSLGYLDAEYTDIFYDISGDGVVNGIDEALDLTRAPEVTGTLNITHELFLPGGSLLSRLSYSHQDELYSIDSNPFEHPAVDKIDLFFTYFETQGRWSVSLYGKNLTDEVSYGLGASFPSPPFVASNGLGINEGRSYGMEVNFNF